MNIDTSDTHKYGEILIYDNNENFVTVGPINGDEDTPNYKFARIIASSKDICDAASSLLTSIRDYQVSNNVLDKIVRLEHLLNKTEGDAA